MNLTITKTQAKAFLLQKQLLSPPQSLSGLEDIEKVFNTIRIIQYDPLNPCGRNPDLVLQSRIKNIHPNDYNHWLYTEKKGIEAYDKELCIIPIEDLSFTSHRNLKAQNDKNKKAFIKKYQTEITNLLINIEADGPICASDINSKTQVVSGWGSSALFGRIALEQLWKMGQLVVVKREGMKKYYDLPQRAHSHLPQEISPIKLAKNHILRRLKSVGLLPKITTGGGWQGLGTGTSQIINSLIKNGEIIEIRINECKLTYLLLKEDFPLITKNEYPTSNQPMVFIAPLDNLIWDRIMVEDLFNFHYRWEVYTPISKRKFGYYTLPILYQDEFIGRIEPIKNKDNNLEIKGLWQERTWSNNEVYAFNNALKSFSNYLKTKNIINSFTPQIQAH